MRHDIGEELSPWPSNIWPMSCGRELPQCGQPLSIHDVHCSYPGQNRFAVAEGARQAQPRSKGQMLLSQGNPECQPLQHGTKHEIVGERGSGLSASSQARFPPERTP